jgi:hypothetical protein
MNWKSNGVPPIYIREGDSWYNQKDNQTYFADLDKREWKSTHENMIPIQFPKKTKVFL